MWWDFLLYFRLSIATVSDWMAYIFVFSSIVSTDLNLCNSNVIIARIECQLHTSCLTPINLLLLVAEKKGWALEAFNLIIIHSIPVLCSAENKGKTIEEQRLTNEFMLSTLKVDTHNKW